MRWFRVYAHRAVNYYGWCAGICLLERRDIMTPADEGLMVFAALRLELQKHRKAFWPRLRMWSDAATIAERLAAPHTSP